VVTVVTEILDIQWQIIKQSVRPTHKFSYDGWSI